MHEMKRWENYNYIILTVGLIFFLLIPFVLKLKDQRLEVFPAVIMPSGAGLINKKDSITFTTYELYGKRKDSIERIEIKEFLKPIPEWYINHISESNFGLEPFSQEFKLYKSPIKFVNFNRYSEKEVEKAKTFYQEKLVKLGYDDSLLIFRNYKIQLKDSVKNKILIHEKYYRLK